MVCHDIAPHTLAFYALQCAGLVFVKFFCIKHLQATAGACSTSLPVFLAATLAIAQVIQHTQAGIYLPNMVRVQALQLYGRCRAQQLLRVQAVHAQGSLYGSGRQIPYLACIGIHSGAPHCALIAQHIQHRGNLHQLLVALAVALHHHPADVLRLSQRHKGFARITAPAPGRTHSKLCQLAVRSSA